MHDYDAALKLLLQSYSNSVLSRLTAGASITRWLRTELPRVETRRADLLGTTASGEIIHIELQSSNDADMPLRMAEYFLKIYRHFRRFPRQFVLYVGNAKLRIPVTLKGPEAGDSGMRFQFGLLDARDLDGDDLLASPHIADNILAILTRLRNQAEVIRSILARLVELDESERRDAFAQFLLLSGLRQLEEKIEEEARKMPITNSLLEHKVIGPAILQGRREGLQEGLQEGQRKIVRHQLEKRFGMLPASVEGHLLKLSAAELDDLAVRLLDAPSLDSLFPNL